MFTSALRCMWAGQAVDCRKIFKPVPTVQKKNYRNLIFFIFGKVPTDRGMCCAFNPRTILRLSEQKLKMKMLFIPFQAWRLWGRIVCLHGKEVADGGGSRTRRRGTENKESNCWDQAGPSSPPGPTFELGQHCKSLWQRQQLQGSHWPAHGLSHAQQRPNNFVYR